MSDRIEGLDAFSQDDINLFVEDEVKLVAQKKEPSNEPSAVLLAGQPGAGKTELSSMIAKRWGGNAVLINADDYRKHHPNYYALNSCYGFDSVMKTAPFSSAVANALIERLSRRHYNLIVEGTGRTVEIPKSTAEKLSAMGYSVEMAVIAVRPEISLISTLLRFYQMNERGTVPRATAIEAHDRVIEALPGNLDTLLMVPELSRIVIWDRSLVKLYDSKFDFGTPSEVLLSQWNCEWTEEEIQNASAAISHLYELEKRNQLGQYEAISEIERRLQQAQTQHESGMTMNLL